MQVVWEAFLVVASAVGEAVGVMWVPVVVIVVVLMGVGASVDMKNVVIVWMLVFERGEIVGVPLIVDKDS